MSSSQVKNSTIESLSSCLPTAITVLICQLLLLHCCYCCFCRFVWLLCCMQPWRKQQFLRLPFTQNRQGRRRPVLFFGWWCGCACGCLVGASQWIPIHKWGIRFVVSVGLYRHLETGGNGVIVPHQIIVVMRAATTFGCLLLWKHQNVSAAAAAGSTTSSSRSRVTSFVITGFGG